MATNPDQFRLAILEHIELTERYETFTAQWLQFDRGRSGLPLAETYCKAVDESRAVINEGIRAVGGLAVQLENDQGTTIGEIRLGAWLGNDPDNPSMHLWKPLGAPAGQFLSVNPTAIEEMREHILGSLLRQQTDV